MNKIIAWTKHPVFSLVTNIYVICVLIFFGVQTVLAKIALAMIVFNILAEAYLFLTEKKSKLTS